MKKEICKAPFGPVAIEEKTSNQPAAATARLNLMVDMA
jgi:hypothetical protein